MSRFRIVETCNFDRDYPDEKFVNLPLMSEDAANAIARAINTACSGNSAPRYWQVRPDDYQLQPGFEP